MRCGSTSIWASLKEDADIFMPENKELHFFDSYARWRDEGISCYAEYFREASANQVRGEATPAYLTQPYAACRIHQAVPGAKLYVVLRDPIDRIVSHYRYLRNGGREPLTLREALGCESERSKDCDPKENFLYDYLNRSDYITHLKRFEAIFGRDAIHVILYERFKECPAQAVCRLMSHLGLDRSENEVVLPRAHNYQGSDVWSTRLQRFANKCTGFRSVEDRRIVSRGVRRLGREIKKNNKTRNYEALDEATRSWLQEQLSSSVRELEDWLGEPIG